jgi:hypothetical protein
LSSVPSPNQAPGGTPVKVMEVDVGAVVAHLQQAVDHAEPVGHRPADAADAVAGLDASHTRSSATARSRSSSGSSSAEPGDAVEARRSRMAARADQAGRLHSCMGKAGHDMSVIRESPERDTRRLSSKRQHNVKWMPTFRPHNSEPGLFVSGHTA